MWARVIGRRKRVIAPTRVKNKYERNYGAWYGGRGDVWGEGDRGAISSRRLRGYRNKRRTDKAKPKPWRPPAHTLFMPTARARLARQKGHGQIHCRNLCLITLSGPMNSTAAASRFVLISRFYRFACRP